MFIPLLFQRVLFPIASLYLRVAGVVNAIYPARIAGGAFGYTVHIVCVSQYTKQVCKRRWVWGSRVYGSFFILSFGNAETCDNERTDNGKCDNDNGVHGLVSTTSLPQKSHPIP